MDKAIASRLDFRTLKLCIVSLLENTPRKLEELHYELLMSLGEDVLYSGCGASAENDTPLRLWHVSVACLALSDEGVIDMKVCQQWYLKSALPAESLGLAD